MGDYQAETPMAGALREGHVGQSATSQINVTNERDQMDGQDHRNVEKEKKTFGRTPDGTGKIRNLKRRRHLSPGLK